MHFPRIFIDLKGYKCYDPASRKLFINFDFKFFENESLFPQTSLQGENSISKISLGNSSCSSCSNLVCATWAATFISCPNSSILLIVIERQVVDEFQHLELHVYSRCLNQNRKEHADPPWVRTHDLNPNATKMKVIPNGASIPTKINDLGMPIALRKRTRSYTLHPISKFVPYHRLSFSYQAFTSNLSSEKNPKFVLEALMIPVWRKAILEEV